AVYKVVMHQGPNLEDFDGSGCGQSLRLVASDSTRAEHKQSRSQALASVPDIAEEGIPNLRRLECTRARPRFKIVVSEVAQASQFAHEVLLFCQLVSGWGSNL